MPIYEYRCNQCQGRSSQFVSNSEESSIVECAHCGSTNRTRIFSAFSVHQSEASRLAKMDSSKTRDLDFYSDPRNIGLYAKKRTKELGMDLGSKLEEVVEKARTGKILDDLP